MTGADTERIESALREVTISLNGLQTAFAALTERVNAGAAVASRLTEHEIYDARIHAQIKGAQDETRADVRRLYWIVGVVFVASLTAVLTSIREAL